MHASCLPVRHCSCHDDAIGRLLMHSMAMLWNGGAGVCRGLCRYLSLFRMCTSVRGKWLRGLATNHRGHSREHGPTDDARACQRISSDLGGARLTEAGSAFQANQLDAYFG